MSAVTIIFRVLKGGVLLKEQAIAEDAIKIGRMASSQLQIEDESISKMHAVVEVAGPGAVQIIDLDNLLAIAQGVRPDFPPHTKPRPVKIKTLVVPGVIQHGPNGSDPCLCLLDAKGLLKATHHPGLGNTVMVK